MAPSQPMQSTVDRLDRPSAYFDAKVSCRRLAPFPLTAHTSSPWQRRRNQRHRDDDHEAPAEDPLAHATTLYVGNL